MIETTGHTWSQISEDWDLPRYKAWVEYCKECPPLRMMVQAYLGIKPKKLEVEEISNDGNELLNLLATFEGAAPKP